MQTEQKQQSIGVNSQTDGGRKERKPPDMCCPEGVWSCEAYIQLAEKEIGLDCGKEKAFLLIKNIKI